MEVEFCSITSYATYVDWVVALLWELEVLVMTFSTIWFNNLRATQFALNSHFHSKMKHMTLDYNFVRERIEERRLQVIRISNTQQQVDVLTKELGLLLFQQHQTKLANEF